MPAVERPPIVLHADQEHGGIRLVIFLSLFLAYFLGFQIVLGLLNTLAPPAVQDYAVFLSCAGGLPIAVLLIWLLENLLKRVWHSGLSLVLDERGISVRDTRKAPAADGWAASAAPGSAEPAIAWGGNLAQLNWYFKLSGYPRGGRERRVSAKWLCLATELHQDGARLNLFTFMPPNDAAHWIDNAQLAFHRLNPVEIYDRSVRSRIGPPSRPALPNQLLHSKDGRYWLAERRRWEYGVELSPQDFTTFMDHVRVALERSSSTGAVSESLTTI